jgi:hypothetical protein
MKALLNWLLGKGITLSYTFRFGGGKRRFDRDKKK